MKSRRMNIAVGNSPPANTRITATCVSISPSAETMRKIGTIAAEPDTTDENSSRM